MSSLPLDDQITARLVDSVFPHGWDQNYMPEKRLDPLITRSSVLQEFSRSYDDESDGPGQTQVNVDESLMNFILDHGKKVFAISLISGVIARSLHKTMKRFQQSQFDDSRLPVAFMDPNKPPWCYLQRTWSAANRMGFEKNQWKFLVHVFDDNQVEVDLKKQHILPFTLISEKRKEGTFSDVWQVAIHEAHQKQPMRMVRYHLLSLITR